MGNTFRYFVSSLLRKAQEDYTFFEKYQKEYNRKKRSLTKTCVSTQLLGQVGKCALTVNRDGQRFAKRIKKGTNYI